MTKMNRIQEGALFCRGPRLEGTYDFFTVVLISWRKQRAIYFLTVNYFFLRQEIMMLDSIDNPTVDGQKQDPRWHMAHNMERARKLQVVFPKWTNVTVTGQS